MHEPMNAAQADDLIEQVKALSRTVALREEQIERTEVLAKKARRNGRALLAVVVVLAGIVVGLWVVVDQNRANAVASCETGNRLREGQRLQAQEDWLIQDTAAEQQGFGEDSPLRVFYSERLAWQLNDLYPYRDCSDLSKKIPEPGKPPSFDKALEEALEQEATG